MSESIPPPSTPLSAPQALAQLERHGVHPERVNALVARGLSVLEIWDLVTVYGPTIVQLLEKLSKLWGGPTVPGFAPEK